MCSTTDTPIQRRRHEVRPGEPRSGTFLVWRVLGFGGRSNPLLYSRCIGAVARASQALLMALEHSSAVRSWSQIYVDDPAIVQSGPVADRLRALNVLILFWLTLGLPLAWEKGGLYSLATPHQWIGVTFSTLRPGLTLMELPEQFLEGMAELLEEILAASVVPTQLVTKLAGRAARVAYVVPEARPFAGAFYAVLTAAEAARKAGAREAPPGRIACRRLRAAAAWFLTLIRGGEDHAAIPLHRLVFHHEPTPAPLVRRVEVDASPWGAGAVLFVDNVPTAWWATSWSASDHPEEVRIGDTSWQSYFEYLALLMVLIAWAQPLAVLPIVGDNTSSLTNLVNIKGRRSMAKVARELAWRKARYGWRYVVGHLPTEVNTMADALSRLADPQPSPVPPVLEAVTRIPAPEVATIWQVPALE